jgi:hypothetical protein
MRARRARHTSPDDGEAAPDADAPAIAAAARRLVACRVLAQEADRRYVDVRIDGRGFRYLAEFWKAAEILEADGSGWRLRLDGAAGAARARRRVAEEWIRAGAPVEWARAEGDSAVDELLQHGLGTAWGTA